MAPCRLSVSKVQNKVEGSADSTGRPSQSKDPTESVDCAMMAPDNGNFVSDTVVVGSNDLLSA
jgi:hypothetical protein